MPARSRVLALSLFTLAAACGPGPLNADEMGSTADVGEAVRGAQCPSGTTVPGIDVSVYQGAINWTAVKASGQEFAIARIGDGTGGDSYFAANWSGIKAAGLLRGAYQFFEPGLDATQQANIVIAKVGHLGAGDFPVMLDVEATGGQSAATITAKIHTWLNAVTEGTGKTPFIYSGAYFWDASVKSADFAALPLNVAWYGTNCPGTPNAWSHWTFHQYSSSGRVSGVSGNVDMDVFNGTLQQLEGYANLVANQAPQGFLDATDCHGIAGWTQDLDAPTEPNDVVVSDGPYVAGNGRSWRASAATSRPDLCGPLGSCDHGFTETLPRAVLDGQEHSMHAYGVDKSTGGLTELRNSPRALSCPATFPKSVRRHIADPASFASFRFSAFMDQTQVTDATLAGIPEGPLFPEVLAVVKAASSPALYVVDGTCRRHIPNPDALAAWHILGGDVKVITDADLAKLTEGPELPARPLLVQGSGAAVYILDAPRTSPTVPLVKGCGAAPGPAALLPLALVLLAGLRRFRRVSDI